MKVSLTFDNGPHAGRTPHVLSVLQKYGLPAVFFPLGKNLAIPSLHDLARRAFAEGHRIGNHSFNHQTPFGLLKDPNEAIEEIASTDRLIDGLGGSERLFRPFGRAQIGPHLLNRVVWDFLSERGFTCVLWNCIAPEREFPDSWMESTLKACSVQDWSVVVLHDIPEGGVLHLEGFVQSLLDRGATFTQEFPVECTPLKLGVPTGDYSHLMPSSDGSAV